MIYGQKVLDYFIVSSLFFYFIGSLLAELVPDSLSVCISRLECPFGTAVELAAFSLQGKHTRRIILPTGISSKSCNCLFSTLHVECYLQS